MVLDPDDITKIVAVLDWEMCTLGDPLADLGTALAYWVQADDPSDVRPARWGPTAVPGSLSRAQLLEPYQKKTGGDVSAIAVYFVVALLQTAVITHPTYF